MVERYRYLGLTVDSRFTWNAHVELVCDKLRAVLVKFHHLKYFTDRATLYTVYYALTESILSYGLSTYGLTFNTYLDKIKNFQIRFMKVLAARKK